MSLRTTLLLCSARCCCLTRHALLQLDDPRIFPQSFGEPFPPNFRDVVRTIFKRVFRVFAHMYHSHFNKICGLSEQAHLNTCFKHFMYFTQVRTSCSCEESLWTTDLV